MSAVTAEMVRTLRASTGAGMMECKKALVECGGDLDGAAEFLRVKSGVKAGKVSARTAGEGRIAFAMRGDVAALAEVNCETDFVARGEAFAEFCQKIAAMRAATDAAEVDAGNVQIAENAENSEGEKARRELVMRVGENVSFGRTRALRAKGAIAHYVHTGDKIAAMADYSGGGETLAREICMHIAALRPEYSDEDEIPADEMQKQRDIFQRQAAETGKPAAVAEKIAEGKLKKHFAERVLRSQPFVKDGDKTVGEVLDAAGMTIHAFRRLEVGGA
ncbi:MAG: translation elongation factor Ts [Gammaproteobacteria bacterium]